MTIQELAEAKAALSASLREQLRAFEAETGTVINNISLSHIGIKSVGSPTTHELVAVEVEVKLP